ncbi:MAG: leucine-rich repeat domain-containing protein [Treponema sp.]|nr:leucine-rich repeat domain-containing protein [Treponema sp.]
MNIAKLIGAAVLAMAFLGCKTERAGAKQSAAAETVPAAAAKKAEEQNLPKKEYGGLFSDEDLDGFLNFGERTGILLYSDVDLDRIKDIEPLAYYYAGNRCADKGEYQEAAKLYAMAAERFESGLFKYSKWRWDNKWKESYSGTLDENGECKEFYYSIYNLSCCMSLLGFLELSEAYLYNAIIAGYPHLNHLLSDPDLANLYGGPNGEAVKARAKELFACGNSAEFFAGKELGIMDGNDGWYFHFDSNGKDVFNYGDPNFSGVFSDERWCVHGTYTVKNFHVLMHFDSQWESDPIGNPMWTGATSERYDAYALPVLKERDYQYLLSYVDAFNDAWYGKREISADSDLVRGTFLEGVLDEWYERACFLRLSVIDSFDKILVKKDDVEWHPEDDEKNRELNRLDAERRKERAATALIKLSKEEIDANARRRLAHYRAFADPIIQGYKEKGTVVTFDAETFADYKKDAQPETEFCYVFIKGTLKNSAAFEDIYKSTKSLFPAGCFLDFTDCTFAGRRHFEEGDYNSPEWFHFEVNDRNGSSLSDRDGETPQAIGIKGIIFPKNIPDRISIYYADSSLEIMEFQDSAFPQVIDFGYYKAYENNSLKAVRLPEGLREIDNFSFMNCIDLKQVYAPKSLERIGHHAFSDCNGLTFEIPEYVRYVQEYVFGFWAEVYIPAYRHHPENFDWYYSCFEGECIHWGAGME